ncbi:MAG: UDP-N-acetylglucosamine--N-acetylmuramyl-(pentapeptide) pyrophosphoryl-undecaprenol N-acetylglucosamine transferase [Acidimicrobiales bacterium]
MTAALVVGGGTGGHVNPAIAIAEALVASGWGDVALVGTPRGLEAEAVPAAGHPLLTIDLAPFPRRGQRRSGLWRARLRAVGKLVAGIVSAWRLVGRERPRVAVSVGGYASVPVVLAARLRRVPLIAVSYDAIPGLANRLTIRLAAATAVAFPDPTLRRAVHTGAPIRRELATLDLDAERAAARRRLGLPADRFTVLVVGGSQGSGAINAVVRDFATAYAGRTDLAIRHVVGRRNAEGWAPRLDLSGLVHQVVPFEYDMASAYAAADVVLARAGASTVAEIGALGLASVLVPWPAAAEDHQTANARWLADVGGAVLIPEAELDVDRLGAVLDDLRDPARRAEVRAASASRGRRDAAGAVARLAVEHARAPW